MSFSTPGLSGHNTIAELHSWHQLSWRSALGIRNAVCSIDSLHNFSYGLFAPFGLLLHPSAAMLIDVVHKGTCPLPSYQTEGSAGMDLCAEIAQALTLNPMQRSLVPTGLHLALPPGFEAQVRPRSGLALKRGLTCLNSPGTIDSDYRGEVGVLLINLSQEPQTIQPGERIAQLVVAPYVRAEWNPVNELPSTLRGEGGFGHTGQ